MTAKRITNDKCTAAALSAIVISAAGNIYNRGRWQRQFRVFLIPRSKSAVYAVKKCRTQRAAWELESGVEENRSQALRVRRLERVAGYAGKNFRSRLPQGIHHRASPGVRFYTARASFF